MPKEVIQTTIFEELTNILVFYLIILYRFYPDLSILYNIGYFLPHLATKVIASSSLNVVVCTLHIEYYLSIYYLNKCIERRSVLSPLPHVEAKKCNATSSVMN